MTLRFAPLVRVSTEQQLKKGESLRTQKAQIQQYVKFLEGTVPDNCWKYSGQEHATPEQERLNLDNLLEDSSKNKFDAVIVCDTSRWSRDNLKSKEGLNILRKNGIRFFVGTMEYDLYNPEHNFILGMSAEVGELQAMQQALKSITSRINKARDGSPATGNLPFGRTYDKKTKKWGIDPVKQKNIKWAAEQYLKGTSMMDIARILEMSVSNLWKVLNHRSGSAWECQFRNKRGNVDETVTIKVPPLLDEKTITAIKEKGQANKTYTHGETKNRYLLSRMIFCTECGYTLFGHTNQNKKRYYKHPRYRKYKCPLKKWVPADRIEPAVLLYLFDMFGDVEKIEKAIERANPDMEKIEKMREELTGLKEKEDRVIKEREQLVKMTAKGIFTDEEADKNIKQIRSRLETINNRIEALENQLEGQPDPEKVKRKSKLARAVFVDALTRPGPKKMANMLYEPYEFKRKIVENAFAGKDVKGNRMGVYVTQTGDPKKPFTFEIRAILDQFIFSMLPESGIDNVLDELGFDKTSFAWYYREEVLPLYDFHSDIPPPVV
jgi:site-specific DNA recombinase